MPRPGFGTSRSRLRIGKLKRKKVSGQGPLVPTWGGQASGQVSGQQTKAKEKQKNRKTEKQKNRKTEKQKNRKTEKQNHSCCECGIVYFCAKGI
jgi:hypothetical protein